MLTKTQATGAVTLAVAYAYDAFGRLSSLKYPSGKVITYSYDTSGEHQTDLTNPFARTMFGNLGLLTSQPLQSVRTGTRVRNDLFEKHCIMHPLLSAWDRRWRMDCSICFPAVSTTGELARNAVHESIIRVQRID
jgi:hypothetical protein